MLSSILQSQRRPSSGRIPVPTQRFAFRAPQAHHESVKMPNPTDSRSSAPCDATSVVILPAAGRDSSPAFRSAPHLQHHQFLFITNEPLFRTSNFAAHTKQTTSVFLCDASERLSRTSNFAIHTKQTTSLQITSLFLFNTKERSQFTTQQSLITNHQSNRRMQTP
jgi:hypothetical protein